MSFRVITADARPASASGEMISSALDDEDDALDLAAALIESGDVVLRIMNRDGEVVRTREEVEAWCAERRRIRRSPGR